MSFFGRNIKKIRGVKGLSQKAFAEVFDLKRATLGAYEEGRSEPKIETIIKIANYFSITIDSLLTADLTVNELLQFKEELILEPAQKIKQHIAHIPYVHEEAFENYIHHYTKDKFIADLPEIQLPLDSVSKLRAFAVVNLEMTDFDKGFYPKDIVIAEYVSLADVNKLDGEIVIAVFEDRLLLRRLFITEDSLLFKAAHKNIEDITYEKGSVKELWLAKYSFIKRLPEIGNDVADKLMFLEKELLKIKRNI
ncbi:helix-turn-helix domain-containing protein [Tenacibaculum geojense]|uniref:Helix-turn-helix domain-containing protein n=2 Tax=Tenacibaculum TaxID=104267 RepID=A0ABW3JP75_9FLAO